MERTAGIIFPWVSPGPGDTEKETTSFNGGRRGHVRKTVRVERNPWDNRSSKIERWDGKDGLQLALLGWTQALQRGAGAK